MKRFKKSDIETRYYHGKVYPCVNVKAYHFPLPGLVESEFGCDERTAERALEYAFECACETFWECVGDDVANFLPRAKGHHQDGRSGGWLCVEGLPPVEEWDAIAVSAWGRFERAVKETIAELTSDETTLSMIRANEWFKPRSERLNFVVAKDGKPTCIADMKAAAIAAGFGPVVVA